MQLVVNLEIESITAKPYTPKKSWFQWICSKFFELWHGHDYFWPPWLWRLLEAKNVIESEHFGKWEPSIQALFTYFSPAFLGSNHNLSKSWIIAGFCLWRNSIHFLNTQRAPELIKLGLCTLWETWYFQCRLNSLPMCLNTMY